MPESNRILEFIYDPVTQRWMPKTQVTGTPVKAFSSGIGTTSTTIYSPPSGTVFSLTKLVITNNYSRSQASYNASGIATSPGTAIGTTGPLGLLNMTVYNSTTVAVTVTFTDGSGGGIIYQNSVAAGAYVDIAFSEPIPIANQVYAYASTSGVVNVSVTEVYPYPDAYNKVTIYDGTNAVLDVTLAGRETKEITFSIPVIFTSYLAAVATASSVDISAEGLLTA